ncbi:MAG: hypothetical protein KDB27_04120 [Planctomycetales bacterium]|nr:hypothetical protein [Planctomycetales bacterium]
MIDRSQRIELSQDLRRLVTGRMTNDEFDDVCYDHYESSPDAAVRAIANFGYGLYSDRIFPYPLRGPDKVSRNDRRMAARCILFLRSDHEYEWPLAPVNLRLNVLIELFCSLGLYGGVAMLIVCSVLGDGGHAFAAQLGIPSAIALAISTWLLFGSKRTETPELNDSKEMGDWEVWPFFRDTDLAKKRSQERGATETQSSIRG